MNLRLLTTAASLCLLLTPKAHAILDVNGNGLSDLWEKQYNNQQLLPPEFDPQADPDHDGWTNAEEAAAGTDPFNSITGILRPAVSHTPAFQTDSDGDGIPETLTPATLHLSWPGTPGKQYSLLHSSHPGDHGQPLEAPFIGNGNQVTYHIPATSSTGNFWRVATTDVDTDEDNLTNAEEHQFGSNAHAKDSDGDGLNDHEEAVRKLNPNSPDTDGDGVWDLEEVQSGHDPGSGESFPPRWISTSRYGVNISTPPYMFPRWAPELAYSFDDEFVEGSELPGLLETYGFPESPPVTQVLPEGYKTADHKVEGWISDWTGELEQARCWLQRSSATSEAIQRTVLRVTKRTIYSFASQATDLPPEIEVLQVAIPPDAICSNPVDLLPTFSAGAENQHEEVNVNLLPVEVEQLNYSSNLGIRFCRWLDAFSGGSFDPDFANRDRDRFRIRIPVVYPELTKIRIKSTGLHGAVIDGAVVEKTTDGDYEVEMKQENGAMVSTWMLLVSDGDDDKGYNGKGTDDGRDDQTLLADFESPILVTFPELNNVEVRFFAQKPLGSMTLDAWFLSPTGDVPEVIETTIGRHIVKMKEIYRQIGVRVAWSSISGLQVNQSWFDSVPASNEDSDHLNQYECSSAMNRLKQPPIPENHIRIGYVDATLNPEASDVVPSRGFTYGSSNGAIISLSTKNDSRTVLGVTAHEAGHIMKLEHSGEPLGHLLMKDYGLIWRNRISDSKRFQNEDHQIIRSRYPLYVPN